MDVCSTVFRMNGLLTLIVTNMKIGVNPLDNKKNCKVVFYLILNKTEIQITYVMN